MNPKDLSKFMSLMLRHEPVKFGLILDAEGFTPINEVLEAVVGAGHREVTVNDIMNVVENVEPDKKRFTVINNDIRANYGHSIDGKIQHEEAIPPKFLYHGTHDAVAGQILTTGLKPMSRQYVHLTTNIELAKKVGCRRGKPAIIMVDASAAHKDGIKFYKANEAFWLVENLPPSYLMHA